MLIDGKLSRAEPRAERSKLKILNFEPLSKKAKRKKNQLYRVEREIEKQQFTCSINI